MNRASALAVLVVTRVASAEPPARPVDGLGVLALGGTEAFAGADVAHADGSTALDLRIGARLAVGTSGFVESELAVGDERPLGSLAFGNLTLRAGLLPHWQRFAALALRVSLPTSPRLGPGATTAAALAAPRIADPELWGPQTASAELLGDWRWQREPWWLQLELGVAGWRPPDHPGDVVLRASIAGGVPVAPWLDLTASFVTRSFALVSGAPERFVHSLILGIVPHGTRGQIALRLEVPIDKSARDDNHFLVGLEARGW